ncbi:MAG: DUF3618 domain-containing protein [Bradymonadaceae bacterium]|nr:DUF3618 domain-containing protein [Lujinxingiaceae bacterium]
MDKADSRQQLTRTTAGGDLVRFAPADGQAGEIRAEIEASRRQIAQSLDALQSEVQSSVRRITDWRGFVWDHPLPSVGAALAFGFYLGLR